TTLFRSERLTALSGRFSREDLLRAFDLLTRAESDIRGAAQPRYHLEMALLRWMYVRKLVPIEDLIAGGVAGASAAPGRPAIPTRAPQSAPPLKPQPAAMPTTKPPVASLSSRTGEPPKADFKDALL